MKVLFVVLLSSICWIFTQSAQAGDPNSGLCYGLTGAAYGFCVSASHLACGTDAEKSGNACIKIEENYVQITGEFPSWLAECPCGAAEIMTAEVENEPFLCEDAKGDYIRLWLDDGGGMRADTVFYEADYPDGTSGGCSTKLIAINLNDDEKRRCVHNIRVTASSLGVACTEP